MTISAPLAGIFVGGCGSRLGGVPKGLLQSRSTQATLVDDIATKLQKSKIRDIVLVGDQPAYANLPIARISDTLTGLGPLAGLHSLARHAVEHQHRFVLALACDMPYLSVRLIRLLCTRAPRAIAVVPAATYREPLCARYDATVVLPLIEEHLAQTFLFWQLPAIGAKAAAT